MCHKKSSKGHELDWNDSIAVDSDRVVVDKNWLEGKEIQEPSNWNPAEQLITYLETLFEAGENVGYVTGSWEKTDEKGTRWLPQKGSWDRTAGQLIELLNDCKGDIGAVLGDYNPEAGAWIRFNPLDGNGCKNENVTEYRYALVESDHMELEQQNAILRELELPIACLVYSGKKSLHAIVRVDAADYNEYRKRVDYLYEVCQKNGIDVDTQNRNPSRLSRITGDENSADQMANFCNQFDKVCTELGCAVIYCHHHSKGNQGGKKSMDRASGSGVFARDPDALLDLIELEPTEALMKQEENKAICKACTDYLNAHFKWEEDLSQDDLLSSAQMISYCEAHLDRWQKIALDKQIVEAKAAVQAHTAWRIEGTLREFPKFEPVNMWFEYPVHCLDQIGVLKDLELEADKPAWQKGREARKKQGEQARKAKKEKYKMAIENFRFTHEDKYPTVKELYEVLKSDAEATGEKYPEEKTVRNSLKEIGFMVNKDTRCICPIPETF